MKKICLAADMENIDSNSIHKLVMKTSSPQQKLALNVGKQFTEKLNVMTLKKIKVSLSFNLFLFCTYITGEKNINR